MPHGMTCHVPALNCPPVSNRECSSVADLPPGRTADGPYFTADLRRQSGSPGFNRLKLSGSIVRAER